MREPFECEDICLTPRQRMDIALATNHLSDAMLVDDGIVLIDDHNVLIAAIPFNHIHLTVGQA